MAFSNDNYRKREVPERWCIFIDILGFSRMWECEERKALHVLGELMRAIYRIGTRVYRNDGERLFVHHMGDGFAIVGDFGESSFERPLGIAVALMRCVACSGAFAKATLAEGDFADVAGCYPEEVMKGSNEAQVVALGGGGLMTLSSVMGTAFIRSYRLHEKLPSGPFLAVSHEFRERIPTGFGVRVVEGKREETLLSIDWLRTENPIVGSIQERGCLSAPQSSDLFQVIRDYCDKYPELKMKWSGSLFKYLEFSLEKQ